jgi:DNA-binding NtrC family response regulator
LPACLINETLPTPHAGQQGSTAPEEMLDADSTLTQAKDRAEKLRIMQALAKFPRNRDRAAMELGISRMTLYNKLRRYGL